jgi:hypothetical protein
MTSADLDRIADRVDHGPGFDVSPRGVSFRPDPELDALLDDLGDDDVPALKQRLQDAEDPLMAMTWVKALLAVATPAAAQAVDDYAETLDRHDPWRGGFPGRRELLLYLGRPAAR